MTHLCVHARGNTSARIHGESIDIRAESELLECTSSNRVNSYPAYDQSSPNLATHPSSFIFHFLIFFLLLSFSFFFLTFLLPIFEIVALLKQRYIYIYIHALLIISNFCRVRLSLLLILVLLDKLCGYSFFSSFYIHFR